VTGLLVNIDVDDRQRRIEFVGRGYDEIASPRTARDGNHAWQG
jgi:hypothetical protein